MHEIAKALFEGGGRGGERERERERERDKHAGISVCMIISMQVQKCKIDCYIAVCLCWVSVQSVSKDGQSLRFGPHAQ